MSEFEGFGAATYGDRIADMYDSFHDVPYLEPTAAVDFLAPLAGKGPALELGIGSGRVALPLAQRGVEVHGIDASQAMLDELRKKPGADRISVTQGSFVELGDVGSFSLIYVVFNTLLLLGSQDEQVRCFSSVAEHLRPGGVFVTEIWVPDPTRYARNQRVSVWGVELDRVHLEVGSYDPVEQRLDAQHLVLSSSGIRLNPLRAREIWPSELDLMARLAGLERCERYGSWDRREFDRHARQSITVFARPRA